MRIPVKVSFANYSNWNDSTLFIEVNNVKYNDESYLVGEENITSYMSYTITDVVSTKAADDYTEKYGYATISIQYREVWDDSGVETYFPRDGFYDCDLIDKDIDGNIIQVKRFTLGYETSKSQYFVDLSNLSGMKLKLENAIDTDRYIKLCNIPISKVSYPSNYTLKRIEIKATVRAVQATGVDFTSNIDDNQVEIPEYSHINYSEGNIPKNIDFSQYIKDHNSEYDDFDLLFVGMFNDGNGSGFICKHHIGGGKQTVSVKVAGTAHTFTFTSGNDGILKINDNNIFLKRQDIYMYNASIFKKCHRTSFTNCTNATGNPYIYKFNENEKEPGYNPNPGSEVPKFNKYFYELARSAGGASINTSCKLYVSIIFGDINNVYVEKFPSGDEIIDLGSNGIYAEGYGNNQENTSIIFSTKNTIYPTIYLNTVEEGCFNPMTLLGLSGAPGHTLSLDSESVSLNIGGKFYIGNDVDNNSGVGANVDSFNDLVISGDIINPSSNSSGDVSPFNPGITPKSYEMNMYKNYDKKELYTIEDYYSYDRYQIGKDSYGRGE